MPTRPYLISPPDLQPGEFAALLARALDAGDVGAFQLRLKDVPDAAVLAAGAALLPVCREREVVFILNDRPDLAREMGADGVHVGQEDASVAEARALMGEKAVIGATCHNSRHLAMEAGEAGADYVAFGAFFPTETKAPPAMADPEIIEWWTELFTLPSVAIGGITAQNCAPLVKAGADFIAASSFVWAHPNGPAKAVEALNKAIAEAS